jgi:hypothetical protein
LSRIRNSHSGQYLKWDIVRCDAVQFWRCAANASVTPTGGTLLSWLWREQIPSEHLHLSKNLHDAAFQKIVIMHFLPSSLQAYKTWEYVGHTVRGMTTRKACICRKSILRMDLNQRS